jgi:hypothetical protein
MRVKNGFFLGAILSFLSHPAVADTCDEQFSLSPPSKNETFANAPSVSEYAFPSSIKTEGYDVKRVLRHGNENAEEGLIVRLGKFVSSEPPFYVDGEFWSSKKDTWLKVVLERNYQPGGSNTRVLIAAPSAEAARIILIGLERASGSTDKKKFFHSVSFGSVSEFSKQSQKLMGGPETMVLALEYNANIWDNPEARNYFTRILVRAGDLRTLGTTDRFEEVDSNGQEGYLHASDLVQEGQILRFPKEPQTLYAVVWADYSTIEEIDLKSVPRYGSPDLYVDEKPKRGWKIVLRPIVDGKINASPDRADYFFQTGHGLVEGLLLKRNDFQAVSTRKAFESETDFESFHDDAKRFGDIVRKQNQEAATSTEKQDQSIWTKLKGLLK